MCLILKSISFGSIIQSRNRRNMQTDNPNTHIHARPLSWFGTDTSIKCDGVKGHFTYSK